MPYIRRNDQNQVTAAADSFGGDVPEGWVEVAADDADLLAYRAPGLALEQAVDAFRNDADYQNIFTQLMTATPAQIVTYMNNNVTNLASARTVLIRMALVLALLTRRTLS